ncbi:MAG: hypothetical protein WBE79_05755, partial [Candidatus Cybelea sp.]
IATTGGAGSVDVFTNATGTPTKFTSSSVTEFFFPTYDNAGNLFLDGEGGAGYALSELAAGSSSITNVTVSGGTLFFPGGLNWDPATSSVILGDQECNGQAASCLYSATVSGGVATITGVTVLLDASGQSAGDVDQWAIAPQGRYVAAGIISQDSNPSSLARWAFPAGGEPINFNGTTLSEPIGTAISNK